MRIIISDGSFINVDERIEKVDVNIETADDIFYIAVMRIIISDGSFINVDERIEKVGVNIKTADESF